jgi:hypothetical protein
MSEKLREGIVHPALRALTVGAFTFSTMLFPNIGVDSLRGNVVRSPREPIVLRDEDEYGDGQSLGLNRFRGRERGLLGNLRLLIAAEAALENQARV